MLEFIILLFLILLIFFILYQKINQQNQINLEQQKMIQEIKERMLLGTQLQDHLKEGIEKTRDLIEELRKSDEVRKEREREFLERIKRIDEIIAGTSTKGMSGEEILRETFKKLPPEMIETNFQVRGKIVEFALLLPNGKRLPIDSKWVAGKLLLELEKETNQEKRKEIIEEIEKEVIRRIKEVKQYIDPDLTWSQAIAAIPDSVYAVCKNAHLKAREENVILMPYSMVLPLLLYIYRFHLQYAISLDIENLQNHLLSITKNLDEMENILENKVNKGVTMVSNAYLEYKNLISRIKSSLEQIKLKEKEELKKLK
jgi:DNA recombination protein RmuC